MPEQDQNAPTTHVHVHMLPAAPGDTHTQPAPGRKGVSALPVSDPPHSRKSPPPAAAGKLSESRSGVDPELVASLNEKLGKLTEVTSQFRDIRQQCEEDRQVQAYL